MAKKGKVSAKTYQQYQGEIVKLCLEFLVLSGTLAWGMMFVDNQKMEQKVLGAAIAPQKKVQLVLNKEDECRLNFEKNCENPATNYCVKLVKDCKDVVDLRAEE